MTEAERQKRLAEHAKLARVQRDSDMRAVMATPHGKRFVWAFLTEDCNVDGSGGVYGGVDSQRLSDRNEGRRLAGIDLRERIMEAAPIEYLEMVTERIQHANGELLMRRSEAVPRAGDGLDT